VQQKVAGKAAQLLSTADLRQITATLTTPLFRQVRRQALAGMAQTLVPRIPGCGDESKPMDVTELGSRALKRVTPAQVAKLRTFMMSPAGQHFNRALAQLMPVLMQAYREEAANAMMVAGGSPEMQDAIRRMPSPITIDQ
jgi:hypothetical protein